MEAVFDLNEQRDAYVVSEPSKLIHQYEYERIKELLKESLLASKRYVDGIANNKTNKREELLSVRKHDTIMLAGVRGIGKTTFMLSILNFIKKGSLNIEVGEKKHAEDQIESLHILDPTLIEDKTHIFINIISMIKAKVEEKAKASNCFIKEETEQSRKYREWEKSFKKLAEGLPSIDGVGGNAFVGESWLDPEFVMKKGVQMAHAANNLEKSFHEFVRQSLDFIGKTAFILCFDDIDTNFGRGWPVLEILHKYLTTPQIITILSGDPSLYSILIRDRQWENFSKKMLKMEARTESERQRYLAIVSHLEEQYFLKLLKPERRVFLDTLYRIDQRKRLEVHGKAKETGTSLRECYSNLLKTFGIYSGGQLESCYRFLASAPLRTQKQLLYTYDCYLKANMGDTNDIVSNIVDIFWSDLAEKRVEVSSLRNTPHYLVPQIVEYLIRNDILVEGYTLTPIFSDHFVNGAQFALGAVLTQSVKNDRSQIFGYWLRVCLTRELGALIEERSANDAKGPSVEDYVEYCAVTKLRSTRYVSRFSTAYIRALLGYQGQKGSPSYDRGTWHGTIPLWAFAGKNQELKDRIDFVLKPNSSETSSSLSHVLGYLPLSGSTNHKGRSLLIYSFYNLLGILGEIVFVARSAEDKDVAASEVARALLKNAQYREYPVPTWTVSTASVDDVGEGEGEGEGAVSEDLSNFASLLTTWARSAGSDIVAALAKPVAAPAAASNGAAAAPAAPTAPAAPAAGVNVSFSPVEYADLVVSPAVLGKIFTRFFYATNAMDRELSRYKLGEWMHRMVVVFLNSVLVVEALEKLNLSEVSLDLKNPVKSDLIFIDNLKNIDASAGKSDLTLSLWLLACPLWKAYIKDAPSEGLYDQILQFISMQRPCNVVFKQDYDLHGKLDRVTIKRGTSKETFRATEPECLKELRRLCIEKKIGPDFLDSSDTDVIAKLKEILFDVYDTSRMSPKTPQALRNRLGKSLDLW